VDNKIEQTPRGQLKKSGIIYMVRLHLQLLMMAIAFFVSAGNLNIKRAWVYFAILSAVYIGSCLVFIKFNPELLNERAKDRDNTKSWDKILLLLYWLIGFFGINIVAGLDVGRFGWSELSGTYMVPGAVMYVAASAFGVWAMIVNKHFEATVRIQSNRDHQVIKEGPYKIVRHPGYLSVLMGILAVPLMTGSLYAFSCSVAVIIIMTIRTFLEDRMLQNELKGYREYTKEVKYRLIPFVW